MSRSAVLKELLRRKSSARFAEKVDDGEAEDGGERCGLGRCAADLDDGESEGSLEPHDAWLSAYPGTPSIEVFSVLSSNCLSNWSMSLSCFGGKEEDDLGVNSVSRRDESEA
jgi:hypothetical protein